MIKVYFVRHCEPNYENHDDLSRELTKKGMEDTRLVSDFFNNIKVDKIYSSPFKRAYDTVLPLAKLKNIEIEKVDDFREREISTWVDDFNEFSKKQWDDFNYKLPQGESLNEVQDRNIKELRKIVENKSNDGKIFVVGSHGTAISTIVNYYDKTFNFKSFNKIKKEMPFITEFIFEEGKKVKINHISIIG